MAMRIKPNKDTTNGRGAYWSFGYKCENDRWREQYLANNDSKGP